MQHLSNSTIFAQFCATPTQQLATISTSIKQSLSTIFMNFGEHSETTLQIADRDVDAEEQRRRAAGAERAAPRRRVPEQLFLRRLRKFFRSPERRGFQARSTTPCNHFSAATGVRRSSTIGCSSHSFSESIKRFKNSPERCLKY